MVKVIATGAIAATADIASVGNYDSTMYDGFVEYVFMTGVVIVKNFYIVARLLQCVDLLYSDDGLDLDCHFGNKILHPLPLLYHYCYSNSTHFC